MKAVTIEAFNTDPVIRDADTPEPGEGEIVVDVAASSVNGMDLVTVNGMAQHIMPYEFPITLGRDFAGNVSSVGRDVSDFAVGDAVFGMLVTANLHDGTFAEQARVPAYCVAKRPEQLSADDAGALGLAGGAAKSSIDALGLADGETVLICGATGGVGALAIQMAKARGAHVVATATPAEVEFVEDLGADAVVDYTGDLAASVRALYPEGVDCVIHLVGDGLALVDLLVPGGRLASTLGVGPDAVTGRNVTASAVMTIPTPDLLGELAAAVVKGELRVPITKRYALDQVTQAMKDFESGVLGKLWIGV